MNNRPPEKSQPSKLGLWLLKRFSHRDIQTSALGDFEEIYSSQVKDKGRLRAGLWFWGQIFRSILPFLADIWYWRINMLKNYIKIALRKTKKQKGYSAINLSGLAIGMAACMLIFLWVHDELSYDRFHQDYDQLQRVMIQFADMTWPVVSIPVGPGLKRDFPEIVEFSRYDIIGGLFTLEDKMYQEGGAFADPSFLKMFSFPLIHGDPQTALTAPDSIVISEAMAEKFFGTDNPIGKVLKVNHSSEYRISAVMKNLPADTHFDFEFIIPFEILIRQDRDPENWGRFQIYTYIQLQKGVSEHTLKEKMSRYLDQHKLRSNPKLDLMPVARIHLHSEDGTGDFRYVVIFSLIAGFILFIACVNYMNLMTARSSTRAKEIGMRKVIGAGRGELIRQFMGESIFFSLLALIGGGFLVYLILPAFNNLAVKSLSFMALLTPKFLIAILLMTFFSGILSGSYPAFFLSSFRPIHILRGVLLPAGTRPKSVLFRKFLVIFQFSIAIFLMISTIIVARQLHFIRNRNLGFEREHLVYMVMRGNMKEQFAAVKKELLDDPNILEVTAMDQLPIQIGRRYSSWNWEGKDPEQEVTFWTTSVDHNYFKTMQMEIIQGRGFSQEFITDVGQTYVLNESALRLIEMESPVGKRFAATTRSGNEQGTIIGIVKDFNFQNLHEKISPLVMMHEPNRFRYICLRIDPDDTEVAAVITSLERVWDKFAPGFPFAYQFMDTIYDRMYRVEQRTGKIFRYFTFLALFISCLGLFGLAAQVSEQRTKEIGIRKVMGASVGEIFILFSRQFLVWVALANILAWPIAYLFMRNWLDQFAYRTGMAIWVFVLSAMLAVIVALMTISYQALKTACINPVESLRYE